MDSTGFVERVFGGLRDFRRDHLKIHRLDEILFLCLCAMTSRCDSFTEIQEFGVHRLDWLRKYSAYENGIASHDTIRRVMQHIRPEVMSEALHLIVSELKTPLAEREVVSIDGKCLRGVGSDVYMVNVWSNGQGLCLSHKRVDEKHNETVAISELLDLLELTGAIITVDALNTQKDLAARIIGEGADYLMALKQNHPTFHSDVQQIFDQYDAGNPHRVEVDQHDWLEKNRGRVEQRNCLATDCFNLWGEQTQSGQWASLCSIARVEASRTIKGVTTIEKRYYLSSLPPDAELINRCARAHWGVENSLHWTLDITFDEDRSYVRADHAPENLATIRLMALNLIKARKPEKISGKVARLRATLSNDFLETVIFGIT